MFAGSNGTRSNGMDDGKHPHTKSQPSKGKIRVQLIIEELLINDFQ